MKEILLLKDGEIVLKGLNRRTFEDVLKKNLKYALMPLGRFEIKSAQSTIYVTPLSDDIDLDEACTRVSRVFGIASFSRAAVCDEKTLESLLETAPAYLEKELRNAKTFKVEAKRSDKRFPLKSPEICAELGGAILSKYPHLKVDVRNPEVTVHVEIRDFCAYIHGQPLKAAGGIPVGTGGNAALLISGGIDSPVAAYMMAKRGVQLEAVHFESFPYTRERAKEKVLELAQLLCEYSPHIKVHVISLTHIQEALRRACDEDYFTLLLRRYMMTLAERVARRNHCGALITGESLAQVASQTMKAIEVTDNAVNMPVFRPCIGLDKEEIVTIARKIGTFETSILPYEDCCTVFTPRHPRTRPELEKVLAEEAKLDFAALCDEALETLNTYDNRIDEE